MASLQEILKLSDDQIMAFVSIDDGVQTSCVTLNRNGVYVATDGEFSVSSGTVCMDAENGPESHIRLGADGTAGETFSVDEAGVVKGKRAVFDEMTVQGGSVLAFDANVVVSAVRPDGHRLLWLCPQETAQVVYRVFTSTTRSRNWNPTNLSQTFVLNAQTQDVMPAAGEYHYKLTVPYDNLGDARLMTFSAVLSKGSQSVSVPGVRFTVANGIGNSFVLEVDSRVNLLADASPITAVVTAASAQDNLVYVGSDTCAVLETTSRDTGSAAQLCSVLYLP